MQLAAHVLAMVLLADRAIADVEVRLVSGRTLRGSRAERVGDRVVIQTASGEVSVSSAQVVAIVAAPAGAVRSGAGLNVSSSDAPATPAPQAAPVGSTGTTVTIEGPAWSGLPSIAPLVRSGDLARAEALVRDMLVAAPASAAARARVALGEILLARAKLSDAVASLSSVSPDQLPAPLRRARDLALAESLSRLNRHDDAERLLAATPPDPAGRVEAARADAERDASLRDRPGASSAHFVVVAPPGSRPLGLGSLMEELERIHQRLTAELGGAPRDRITVLLYPGTEFWEATGMTTQVAALYDGRVRVPAGRVDPPTDALAAALRHEVAHAFVDAISGGRADMRWHEGIAEHFEGSDAGPTSRALARGLKASPESWPPAITHATSHARLDWFLGRWGMAGVRDVLAGMASRGTIDAAVRAATGSGESDLDEAWRRDLLRGND